MTLSWFRKRARMAAVCKYLGYAVVLLLVAAGLAAQTGQPPLAGEMPPQTFDREAPKTNLLVTGLRFSSDFDDNGLNNDRNKQHVLSSVIEPHLGWVLLRPRYNWILDYHFGFTASYPLPIYDSHSHLVDTELQLNVTSRLKVRLRNRFLDSKDPFDRLPNPESESGFGILDRPNDSLVTSVVRRTSEQTGVDLTYALGRHNFAGVSGSFFQVNYGATGESPAEPVLGNSSSVEGHGFYVHHLTPHYWAGLEYNLQKLSSRSAQSRALVNSVFYTQTITLSPEMSITAFAGPEHLMTEDAFGAASRTLPAAPESTWHWAGGATYTWTHVHSVLTVEAYRKISDGGGILGTVRLLGAAVQLRHQLSRKWTANVAAAYDRNQPISGSSQPISYVSAVGGLTRTLGQDLSLEFRYWRAYVPNASLPAVVADHNRVSLSLAYDFRTPLGR